MTFSAYNPYGRLLCSAYEDESEGWTADERNLLPAAMMPPAPGLEDRAFLLYNPGEVEAPLTIRMMAACDGEIHFRNLTNETECVMTGLAQGNFGAGQYFEIDGEKMTVHLRGGAALENGCAYHDMGYISLAPNRILAEGAEVSTTAGSAAITASVGTFSQDMVGAYIWLDGQWKRINAVEDTKSAAVSSACAASAKVRTKIASMNNLQIASDAAAVFTKLELSYTPRVR